jgi:hypothetical protein
VKVEGVEPAQPHAPYPHFIEGARRCPPEDVGGTPGFEGFLEAVTTPRHPERRTLLDWYGGPYDPKDINRQVIEYRFAQIAKRPMSQDLGRLPQQAVAREQRLPPVASLARTSWLRRGIDAAASSLLERLATDADDLSGRAKPSAASQVRVKCFWPRRDITAQLQL